LRLVLGRGASWDAQVRIALQCGGSGGGLGAPGCGICAPPRAV